MNEPTTETVGTDTKQPRGYAQTKRAIETFGDLPDEARVRLPVASIVLGVSAPTIWRWTKEKTLGGYAKVRGCATWQVGEIRRLLKSHGAKA